MNGMKGKGQTDSMMPVMRRSAVNARLPALIIRNDTVMAASTPP